MGPFVIRKHFIFLELVCHCPSSFFMKFIFSYISDRGEHRTRFFFPVLLPTFVLAGGRTGQKPKMRPVLQDRTACPVLSSDEHKMSCPTSYLRPGGRQDRTKTKNASSPTGPPVLCSALIPEGDHGKKFDGKKISKQ